jgi:drug/metabolite transporter (DMT)-like permease
MAAIRRLGFAALTVNWHEGPVIQRLLPENQTLRAGLYMVLAMGSFVVNDSCVKVVGQTLPVGEIIGLRGTVSVVLIALIAAWHGVIGEVRQMASRPVVIRASLDLMSTIAFIVALMHMEIANLTAILQAVPLAVALLSAVFLGERVGIRRSTAIAVGFIGVLFIVRPTPSDFTLYDGLALLIVFGVAVRDLVTKLIPAKVPTLIVALANALFVTIGGFLFGMVEGFVWPELWQILMLMAAAVFLACGYMFMVATLRLGELSATAPFRYSIMLFAIFSGVAVFGEFPDGFAVIGMVLIVAAGLYAAHRELLLRHSAGMPAR